LKELWSRAEWRREGLQSRPCPNQAGREKRDIFFQSQPPQFSTVTCFGHEKRIIFSQQKCTIMNCYIALKFFWNRIEG
jgi:hypothetical protein